MYYPVSLKTTLTWAFFLTVAVACGYYYLVIRKAYFDDTYIYLTIARNAIDYGTWQYYPQIVDRPALIASSPMRIVALTIATGLSRLIGLSEHALFDAKVTLLISGWISWLFFLPFWRKRLGAYAIVGAIFAALSLCFDTTFEFEGGLLFLWITSLVFELRAPDQNPKKIGWLLPLGVMIRPDMALPVVALVLLRRLDKRLAALAQLRACVLPTIIIVVAWTALALGLRTYPIPVTYWAKAALPFLVEKEHLLPLLPERLGVVLTEHLHLSPLEHSIIGWSTIILSAACALLFRPKFGLLSLSAFLILALVILSQLPANFWWYYQNIICLLIGFAVGVLLTEHEWCKLRLASSLLGGGLLVIAVVGSFPNLGPSVWSPYLQSRAQGYLSLATLATGRGTVTLPSLGEVIIKNPEIGMMAYFSKRPFFQWDSAGLAQPLNNPAVLSSPLRFFYPKELRTTAIHDAQSIVDRIGKKLPVEDVWAMEDRDYARDRKYCQYVFPEYALCVNPFTVVKPRVPNG